MNTTDLICHMTPLLTVLSNHHVKIKQGGHKKCPLARTVRPTELLIQLDLASLISSTSIFSKNSFFFIEFKPV